MRLDLTYTIGWLVFGMGLLTAGISLGNRAARVAAVTLIAVTTFKCFLYDLSSLEGLRVWVVRRPRHLACARVSRAAEVRPQDEDRDVKRAPLLVAAIALSIFPLVALAQKAPESTYERPVVTAGAGPYRLAIDAGLLTAGAPFRALRGAKVLCRRRLDRPPARQRGRPFGS